MYIEAPTPYEPSDGDPMPVFLAGGITGCPDWQAGAAAALADSCVVLNPRRAAFDVDDPDAAAEQIAWEHKHLHLPKMVTMFWFPACAMQPIALFELGAALERETLDRPVTVGADPNYPRRFDIVEQLRHYSPGKIVVSSLDDLITVTKRYVDPIHAFGSLHWDD